MTEEPTKYHGKYFLTLVFASILLVTFGMSTHQVFAISNTPSSPAINYTFLKDGFDNDLSGWQYYGNAGYQLSLDRTTGSPSPSANISGDAWLGNCSKHGMYKIVDISSYTGGSLTLGLNWRASSSSTYGTTEAAVEVDNADTGAKIFSSQLANSGATDTGWQYYSSNISNYLSAEKRLQVVLYLNDCWSVNYNENNWYDNVSLVWNTTPSKPNAPTGLTATAFSSSQINLGWSAPANNGGSPIIGYQIERSTDFGSTWSTIVQNTDSTATTYSDTGLQSTYYTYRVSAINVIGTGPTSNTATSNPSNASTGGKTIEFSSSGTFTGTVNASDTVIIDKGVSVSSNGITNQGYIRNMGALQMNSGTTLENYGLILSVNGGQISSYVLDNYQSANMTSDNTGTGIYFKTLNNYGTLITYSGLTARSSTINNYATGTIQSYNSGTLYSGMLNNYGLINNYGGLSLYFSGMYTNGTFNNHASIQIASDQGSESITNGPGGIFNNFAGSGISIPGRTGGYVKSLLNSGTFNNNGTISNSNRIGNSGTFNNDGTISQTSGGSGFPIATLTNSGIFNNNPTGTITDNGIFTNECQTTYENNGTFNGYPVFGDCTTNQIISINPTSGSPGTQVTIMGNNFKPNHSIAITFDHSTISRMLLSTNPSSIISNSTGGFTATFQVPTSSQTGHNIAPTDGAYSVSNTFTISAPPTTPPSAPQNLTAYAGNSQVILGWKTPSSDGNSPITNYAIYRGTSPGSEILLTQIGNSLGYIDNAVTNGQTYYYYVKAVNAIGQSPPSNETITQGIVGDAKLFLNDHFDSDLNGWTFFGYPGYQLNLDTTTGQPSPSAHVSGDTWQGICSIEGMNKVVNIPNAGEPLVLLFNYRAASSLNYVTTNSEINIVDPSTNATLFTYRLVNGGSTDSGWQTYSDDISQYVSGKSKIKLELNLYDCWSSDYSQNNWYDNIQLFEPGTVTHTVPDSPSGLTANTASSSQINLAWTAPTNNGGSAITGYEVERSRGNLSFGGFSNSTSTTFFSTPNATAFTDNGLGASTTYNYTVFAKNSVGPSSHSNTASATTSAASPPPTGITLNNVQSTSGTVSTSPYQITLSNFNAGTGNNQLLVVGVSANNNNVASITFSGAQLTKSVSSFHNNYAGFWYLKNPSGTGNIVVTMAGPTSAVVGAYSFSGVNQSSPLPTSTTNHNSAAGSPTVSIATTNPNDWVLDLPSIYGGVTLGSPTCTQQWNTHMPSAITGASSSAMVQSPGSVTCKWTASSGDLWDDVAIEIKAS